MRACRKFGYSAEQRRKHPHPMHRALMVLFERLGIEYELEAEVRSFYADFLFRGPGLILELDGKLHDPERDKIRDAALMSSHYIVVHFSTSVPVGEVFGKVCVKIAENLKWCHRCRVTEKKGRRFCPTCSAEVQEEYRVKRLKLPPRTTFTETSDDVQRLRRESESPSWAWKHPKRP